MNRGKFFHFEKDILESVAGGQSVLDLPKLNIHSLEEAYSFVQSYGFDLQSSKTVEKLWYYHRRALVLLHEKLGCELNEIPEILQDRKKIEDICNLLIWASDTRIENKNLQRWSCAFLRVMHVFVHTENDLFSTFSEEIQKQVLSDFQACIVHDGTTGITYLKHTDDSDSIPLIGFEIKPFKTSSSTVIKLLAKSDALAMGVYDKLGVRFITKNLFDTFRVIRFLVDEHLISFPHIMPFQSTNTIYPIELFIQTAEELADMPEKSEEEMSRYFADKIKDNSENIQFVKKENVFSGKDYRFIKFITRKLIRIESKDGPGTFSFFYPFEIQIMDQTAHQEILSGPSEHQAYKERQKQAAKKRIFSRDQI